MVPDSGSGTEPLTGSQKGVFDHLAEYLLQQPPLTPGASAPSRQPSEALAPPADEQPPAQELVPTSVGRTDMRPQELVFRETAEQLVVGKEAFVREEVVLSKLVEEHVEEIRDRVKRTEVEIERISPEEATRIVEAAPVQLEPAPVQVGPAPVRVEPAPVRVEPAPITPPARPAAVSSSREAPAKPRNSTGWWIWFVLIVLAAILTAFALGQFLGSAAT
jgi:hypothetical protein